MLNLKKAALGTTTQSRTVLALFAATLLVGGTATEASARSNRHHGHRALHEASNSRHSGWREANASIGSGGGGSFSGFLSSIRRQVSVMRKEKRRADRRSSQGIASREGKGI